jgi:hypothetical protein
MTYAYRVDRVDGATTCFDFTDTRDASDDPILRAVGLSDLDLFRCSQIFRDLSDCSDVKGRWQSSDPDPAAAAGDIIEKIRTDFGFETKIVMFNDQGNRIVRSCFSGTFLLQRISN